MVNRSDNLHPRGRSQKMMLFRDLCTRSTPIIFTRKPHLVLRSVVRQSLQNDGKFAIQPSESSISTCNRDQDRRSRHRWTSSHLGLLPSAWQGVKLILSLYHMKKKRKRSKYELAFYILDLWVIWNFPKSESELGVMDGTYYYLPRE